jgi:hypothetical protein
MHVTGQGEEDRSSYLDAGRALLEELEDVPPLEGRLDPAFPVRAEWMAGDLGHETVRAPNLTAHLERFAELREVLRSQPGYTLHASHDGKVVDGELLVDGGVQGFRLALRSQRAGDALLLRASSQVSELDLTDDSEVDRLSGLLTEGMLVKLCVLPRTHTDRDAVLVQDEIAFAPELTHLGDITGLVERTAAAAARLRSTRSWPGPSGEGGAEIELLCDRIDALISDRDLPWSRKGRAVHVRFPRLNRGQTVRVTCLGPLYRFYSVLESADKIGGPIRRRARLRLAWRRNALIDMVAFGLDWSGSLIGFLDRPAASLESGELEIYLETVARESDRLEYVLTGRDDA